MKRYNKEDIATWLKEYHQSGQSIKKFSEAKAFDYSTLYYWLRKENGKQAKPEKLSGFNRVELSDRINQSSIQIHYPHGVILNVEQALSVEQIIKLIKC